MEKHAKIIGGYLKLFSIFIPKVFNGKKIKKKHPTHLLDAALFGDVVASKGSKGVLFRSI
jgi:hypothetical protein